MPFFRKAKIDAFEHFHLPKPPRPTYYIDDVAFPPYLSAPRTYAYKQRRGVQEDHVESLDTREHLDDALASHFPLSLRTPLPSSLEAALDFVSPAEPEHVHLFWFDQLVRMEQPLRDTTRVVREWNHLIPEPIRSATGKISLSP